MLSVAALAAALLTSPAGVSPGAAQVTEDDLSMLSLVFRNRFVPFSEAQGRSELTSIVEHVSALGRDGDSVERYKAMIDGLARMYLGRWDEGAEVASLLDMDLAAKAYEPGARVSVRVVPLYQRAGALTGIYSGQLHLIDPGGAEIYEADPMLFDTLAPMTEEVVVPRGVAPGRYVVRYSLSRAGATEPIVSTGRSIYVIEALEERLAALQLDNRRAANRRGARTQSRALASTTVLWYLQQYERARSEWIGGAYMGYPVVLNSIFEQGTLMVEAMDFAGRLALAEDFVSALSRGQDPIRTNRGDLRLAYRSGADRQLVLFRMFVPESYNSRERYPLVLALHGAGGDENTFMDSFDGTFEANALERGYLAASVSGRGPYEGYRGDSARDVLDVLDLVQRVYSVDESRTYLMGHSIGGAGTVRLGFENAERFAALAPIAGYGSAEDLAKAPEMPLFLAQGAMDARVPVETARAFYETAQPLGMANLEYVEKPGADHVGIVAEVMAQVFDWFDSLGR
jgi:predicted esterase